jgi:hypothetical protein
MASAQARLTLSAPSHANAGYFQLDWQNQSKADFFQLLESREPQFIRPRVLYKGPDLGSHISGKANGDYYYRVIAFKDNGDVIISNDVKVTVQHHSLTRAFLFFGIGAVVFIATLIVIVIGNRRTES